MVDMLEDFYFGKIRPFEKDLGMSSRQAETIDQCEERLAELFPNGEMGKLVSDYKKAYEDAIDKTEIERFSQGFCLGVRMVIAACGSDRA